MFQICDDELHELVIAMTKNHIKVIKMKTRYVAKANFSINPVRASDKSYCLAVYKCLVKCNKRQEEWDRQYFNALKPIITKIF